MAWSKNVATYPAALQEIWLRLMETELPSVHGFKTNEDAKRFQKSCMAIRYAHMQTKGSAYGDKSASFTAELIDPLTVRLCAVDQTERAQLAGEALVQRREQDKERGVKIMEFAPTPEVKPI